MVKHSRIKKYLVLLHFIFKMCTFYVVTGIRGRVAISG